MASKQAQSKAVHKYIEYLGTRPQWGQGNPHSAWPTARLEERLKTHEEMMNDPTTSVPRRIKLAESCTKIRAELEIRENSHVYEENFISYGKTYSDAHGISKSTWRDLGVPKDVLKKAGV
jgi:hypothetical protein